MIEQEAGEWAARLMQIWAQTSPCDAPRWNTYPPSTSIHFQFNVVPSVVLYFVFDKKQPFLNVILERKNCILEYDGDLYSYCDSYVPPENSAELVRQFVDEWLSFFRRGCWLCGCPIEATAHEKAEWLRGFTREEIEAWNLKL